MTCGIPDRHVVPVNRPRIFGKQAQEDPEEGRLPGSDTAGDHREGPTLEYEIDVGDPVFGTWEAIGKPFGADGRERVLLENWKSRNAGQRSTQVDRAMFGQTRLWILLEQGVKSVPQRRRSVCIGLSFARIPEQPSR